MILLQFGVVLGKVFMVICMTMMVRWTLPRFRFDQLMRLSWEGMIPASLLLVLVTSFMVWGGWTGWMWAGSLAALVIIVVMHPLMPRQASPNRRVPMIGSRFNPVRETGHGEGFALGDKSSGG